MSNTEPSNKARRSLLAAALSAGTAMPAAAGLVSDSAMASAGHANPGTGDSAVSNLQSRLAQPAGAAMSGYKAAATLSHETTVGAKLLDLGISLKADYQAAGNAGSGNTDDTAAVQKFMNAQEIDTRTGFVPDGYYSVTDIQLGNVATTGRRFAPSGQGPGIYHLHGTDRSRSVFVARPGTSTVLKRKNLSGVKISQIGIDCANIADVGLDLAWDIDKKYPVAPSNNNVLTDIYCIGAKLIGISLVNFYDSTVQNIRSVGSPVAMNLSGGGGQLNLNNCLFHGLLRITAQNITISNTPILGGLDINGNSDNRISIQGCQLFPVQPGAGIAAYKHGLALDTSDSGSYGANVSAVGCFFFGETNCIQGKFSHGFRAENCTFNYTGLLLANITGGLGKPMMRFENCSFPATGTPLGTNPAAYYWEMVNCFVGSERIHYASNLTEGYWKPMGNGVALTVREPARWYRQGNIMMVFADVSWPVTLNAEAATIGGLPLPLSGGIGTVTYAYSGYTDGVLNGHITGSTIVPNLASSNQTPNNAAMSGKRLALSASYPVAMPLSGK